ncbi:hypothetical protein GUITHDRAFT_134917 [Guillardia theta CCMP2712]|uniref:BK channel n=1 Tax=Guillardia theta (strain CCMP2712) TaxID=905079 RepID=L1JRL7_GUITC|nr:hypothetical protein GUITHDRAFT_134917 [Guillardia theta CCMP2712]EKX50805.1 hypothetical protein GUITHDRAFT_134917 [Guillardia theta CCMP2712]|eukprot:XP_005837785.1 hypothetical protein GUITHDRAFT_134917 [Guillardia theta CCMP2712]
MSSPALQHEMRQQEGEGEEDRSDDDTSISVSEKSVEKKSKRRKPNCVPKSWVRASERVRGWVEVRLNGTFGVRLEVFNGLCSFTSVLLYCLQTYVDRASTVNKGLENTVKLLDQIQNVIIIFFLSDFLLRLYAAENRWKHLHDKFVIIDIVTIFPPFLVRVSVWSTQSPATRGFTMPTTGNYDFLRVVRMLKVVHAISVLRWSNSSRLSAADDVSRKIFISCAAFCCILLCFSGMFLELENQFGTEGDIFLHDALYFVICSMSSVGYGDISPTTLSTKMLVILMICAAYAIIGDQLNQFNKLLSTFSPWARAQYKAKSSSKHVVVCGETSVSSITEFLEELFHPDHGTDDMLLFVVIVGTGRPSQAFQNVIANWPQVTYLEGSVMQERTLERADIVKASSIFLFCDKEARNPKEMDTQTIMRAFAIKEYLKQEKKDVPLFMQIIQPESKVHFTSSAYGTTNYQIVCIDELKLRLLGKSCICPGFCTLISNLARSCSTSLQNSEQWIEEYTGGSSKEIYRVPLPSYFCGMSFAQAVNLVFEHTCCTLFAIEISDAEGVMRSVLFPGRYEIPSGQSHAYMLAESVEDVARVSDFRDHFRGRKEEEKKTEFVIQHESSATCEKSRVFIERMDRSYHITRIPRDLSRTILETAENFSGHILVCGHSSSIGQFVQTLRQKHLVSQQIVILHPEIITSADFAKVAIYPEVYFVQGRPMNGKDLIRAGMLGCSKAVVLSGSNNPSAQDVDGVLNEEAAASLVDSDSVLTYHLISNHNKKADIVCELRNSANMKYLMKEDRNALERDHTLCPPFASGKVYINSILDKLICQLMYNSHLNTIIRELVVSSGLDHDDFTSGDVFPSELFTIPVPSSFDGKPFIQLFQFLVSKQNILPIGLYRQHPTDDFAPLPYVVSAPPRDLVLNKDDQIFTLISPLMSLPRPKGLLYIKVLRATLQKSWDIRLPDHPEPVEQVKEE